MTVKLQKSSKNSEAAPNAEENIALDRKIPKGRYIFSRTKIENYWWSKIDMIL